jgi:CIC family chloride channel protein
LSTDRRLAALLVRALAVGLLGGAAAILLRWAATEAPHLLFPGRDMVDGVTRAAPLHRLLVPAIGGLAAGLVLALGSRLPGAARGWDILEAIVLRSGDLPLRSALVRGASSILTQASAGAVGREGPIVLIAAAVASRFGVHSVSSTRERRILLGCGAAAGLACAYNTPLGAALFTMEILFGSFALDAFAPLAVSSAVATVLAWAAFGRGPVFHVAKVVMASPLEIALYVLLGLLGGLVAAAFLVVMRTSAAVFRRSGLPRPVAMALAGLALGFATLHYPHVVGNGREAIAALFERPWTIGHVLALLALRLVLTPLAVGSGTVGGVYTPTLFLGAMLGQAFGATVSAALPGIGAEPTVYALAGMGCLLAGTTHAPLTSVVMVFEMTLDYGVVVPLLVGSAVASVVAQRLSPVSVYTEALARKAGVEGAPSARLDVLHVADLLRAEQVTVAEDLAAPELLEVFVRSRRNHLYVVGRGGEFHGAVNLHDVNEALGEASDPHQMLARDLLQRRFETTTPAESLSRVLERFAAQDSERLPVLAADGSRRLLGTISKRDVLAAYARDLIDRRGGGEHRRP